MDERQLIIERMSENELLQKHLVALNAVLEFDMWVDYSHTAESILLEELGSELRTRMSAE